MLIHRGLPLVRRPQRQFLASAGFLSTLSLATGVAPARLATIAVSHTQGGRTVCMSTVRWRHQSVGGRFDAHCGHVQAWQRGEVPKTRASFDAAFSESLDPRCTFIVSSGACTGRAAVAASFWDLHGAKSGVAPPFEIEARNIQTRCALRGAYGGRAFSHTCRRIEAHAAFIGSIFVYMWVGALMWRCQAGWQQCVHHHV